MKKWNNYMLFICAFLLLLICILSISGSVTSQDGTDNQLNDTTVCHQNS